MITHIDLGSVLRRTGCALYSNLVTRATGVAVRTQIEELLSAAGGRTLTVIDFSQVVLMDFSCADEIVAKLLLRDGREPSDVEAYFIFRGVSESHLDAIESVLERRGLALVAQIDGGPARLVGTVGEPERRVWEAVMQLGRADAADVAEALGEDPREVERALERLRRRRLVMRLDDGYIAVGALAA